MGALAQFLSYTLITLASAQITTDFITTVTATRGFTSPPLDPAFTSLPSLTLSTAQTNGTIPSSTLVDITLGANHTSSIQASVQASNSQVSSSVGSSSTSNLQSSTQAPTNIGYSSSPKNSSAIIGAVVGGLVLLNLLVIFIILFIRRRRKRHQDSRRSQSPLVEPVDPSHLANMVTPYTAQKSSAYSLDEKTQHLMSYSDPFASNSFHKQGTDQQMSHNLDPASSSMKERLTRLEVYLPSSSSSTSEESSSNPFSVDQDREMTFEERLIRLERLQAKGLGATLPSYESV